MRLLRSSAEGVVEMGTVQRVSAASGDPTSCIQQLGLVFPSCSPVILEDSQLFYKNSLTFPTVFVGKSLKTGIQKGNNQKRNKDLVIYELPSFFFFRNSDQS